MLAFVRATELEVQARPQRTVTEIIFVRGFRSDTETCFS